MRLFSIFCETLRQRLRNVDELILAAGPGGTLHMPMAEAVCLMSYKIYQSVTGPPATA